ncbi:MAG: hypothetical protein FJ102_12225, partial [Deltaproteobacteria bacterium]|nr:hypothetical protein [Deltaproteobacteria bacterium]
MSLFSALAETIVPPGRAILGANADTVSRLEAALGDIHPALAPGWRALGYAVDAYAVARTGRRFESLPLGRRLQLLNALDGRECTRNLVRGLVAPLKLAALDDPAQHAA